jgi:hypothetical protein
LSALNHLTVPVAVLVFCVLVLGSRRKPKRRPRALGSCQLEPIARAITGDNSRQVMALERRWVAEDFSVEVRDGGAIWLVAGAMV